MARFSDFSNQFRSDRSSPVTDKCQNAEPGTFGHECGKPAHWVAQRASKNTIDGMFRAAFCNACKSRGFEARSFDNWIAVEG